MGTVWRRIERWLDTQGASMASTLRPGATPEALREAEATLDVAFPEPLARLWTERDGGPVRGTIGGWRVLSLREMVRTTRSHAGRPVLHAGQVKVPWNDRWVVFASDSAGNLAGLNLDPAVEADDDAPPFSFSSLGEVFVYVHGERRVAAQAIDLDDWFDALLAALD